jgi:hypothetical protein
MLYKRIYQYTKKKCYYSKFEPSQLYLQIH